MKIVSFYCDIEGGNYYSEHAKRLKAGCDNLGIESLINYVWFGKDWISNVNAKPQFLLDTLLRLKEAFIWLDVDCSVNNIDFEIKGDWGVVKRSDGFYHDYVHYINYTYGNLTFLNNWIDEVEKKKMGSHGAFLEIMNDLNWFEIPDGHFELGLATPIKSRIKILERKC